MGGCERRWEKRIMIDHPHNCTTTKAHRQAVLRVEQPPVQEPHPERVEGRQRRGALKGLGAVYVGFVVLISFLGPLCR